MISGILSPLMSLQVPTVGVEAGPLYAVDINQSLTIIDGHNHTPGSGAAITPAAMSINADLTFANNSLLNSKSLQFQPQVSMATPLALYVKAGSESPAINDLWFNDGNGNIIQITSNGATNVSAASIPGESYNAGTFVWRQGAGSTVPANFDIGAITLRPNSIPATTRSTTIQVNPFLVTDYTLTLPNNPNGLASNSFLTMDASGAITAGATVSAGLDTTNLKANAGILGSQIALNTISGSNIVNGTITGTQLNNTGVVAGSYTSATITVDAQGRISSATSNGIPSFGTYTPSINNLLNGTVGAHSFQYMQIGTTVNVSGSLTVTGTGGAGDYVQFNMSLPVFNSNFTLATQAAGNGTSDFGFGTVGTTALVKAAPSTTVTLVTTNLNGGMSADIYIIFTYRII